MKKTLLLFLCTLPLMGCIEKAVNLVRATPPMLERVALLKDAEAGDIEKQYQLGQNYCCGPAPLHDNAQALYWWCQAGRQGQADALYEIGKLFENTRGLIGSEIPVDPAKAYAFYQLAEKGYQRDAALARKLLEKKLTDSDRRNAEDIVRNWPDAACELPSTLKPKPDPSRMIRDAKLRDTI